MKTPSRARVSATLILLGGLLAAMAVHGATDAAPRISVVFVEPEKFTDAGYSEGERGAPAILEPLQRFIVETAARYLPKITDIDLAGDFEPLRGPQAHLVRIIKGLYPPRIVLEFRLADAADRTVKGGKRNLTDIDYQLRTAYPHDDYLRYEKELLRDWLRDELGALKGKTH
jgi:hypothetical protein